MIMSFQTIKTLKLGIVVEKIDCRLQSIDNEYLMYQMTSRSKVGWKTVQMNEEETLIEEYERRLRAKLSSLGQRKGQLVRRKNCGNRRGGKILKGVPQIFFTLTPPKIFIS